MRLLATKTKYIVTVANKTHTVEAFSAIEACEYAQERWGSWPDHIQKDTE